MPPPVAVYVVAAVVSVAAVFVFKEFVYEPHIAPKFEAWAEDFLERRRAARNRRAGPVPVRTPRRRDASPSSDSSHHDQDRPRQGDDLDRPLLPEDLSVDGFELEALASREVDEWRNEVLRSQERTQDGLRRRRAGQFRDSLGGFDSASTTLDESFTSLTHTPLASTHVISNLSSPITHSTISLPLTPTRRRRSESQSTTTQRDANTTFVPPSSPPAPIFESPAVPPIPIPCLSADGLDHLDIASSSSLAIPNAVCHSPATEGMSHPLSFTPTYETMTEDSPFGPLLPDTPRSSAEIYGERPFSPITRVMGSSAGSRTLSSRANSTSSVRTLALGPSLFRKGSGLANEVMASKSDDGSDDEDAPQASTSTFSQASLGTNASVISSLSERYPAAPTPPVIVSPPASSIGVLSPPSSPGSGGSEVVVDILATAPHSPVLALPPTHARASLPMLELPSDGSSPRMLSPALSFASFLSPMPLSRTASESEGDEFLSVASEDSDGSEWGVSSGGPVQDRGNNPFLSPGSGGSDHEDEHEHPEGSEGSEVLVSDLGQEIMSEVGSDESWGEIGR